MNKKERLINLRNNINICNTDLLLLFGIMDISIDKIRGKGIDQDKIDNINSISKISKTRKRR